jgi:NADPH-dependent glutamate synthase beta subunit-like oxidoreductase/dihydroorotate dehydrogenase
MKVDLDETYLPVKVGGLTFRNPFYVGSGPTTKSIDHLIKAAENGWAGASIKLTFDPEPYVSLEPRYGWFDDQGFLSFSAETRLTVEEGLRLVEEGRRRTKDFIIMANITYVGEKPGVQGWVDMARRFEAAGAHIIELNMCCPNMSYNVAISGTEPTEHQTGASLGQNAEAIGHIVREVVRGVGVPVFVKLTPEGGRIGTVAQAAYASGAAAVGGAANRLGVPMLDIYNPWGGMYKLQKEPSLSCLSGPWIRPLAFRDIYEIRKLNGRAVRITGAGGIMTLQDVVMASMCGADLFCICTGILLKGFEMLPPLVAELRTYLAKMGYKELSDARDLLVEEIAPATELTLRKGYARKKNPLLRGPCQAACPFGVPAQDYVTLVAEGDFREAYRMITQRNPLQSICGWVCNHPCETECTRGDLDEPIRIRDLKRFVIERAARGGWKPEVSRGPVKQERVAVVGSGPAGLSAAHHLARAGYPVTVFEAKEKPGGMLRYAIPRFRLPEAVLDAEIKAIADLGVRFVCGNALGKDFTMASLKEQGYKAIVLAVGAGAGLPLGVPGEDGAGSMTALDFLGNLGAARKTANGRRVAVIGGGFTAVDSARAAVRLGAKEVYLLYRRTRSEMPATSEEVDEAEAEGVKVMYLVSPKELIRSNGSIESLRMVNHVLGKQDDSGRRRPEEVEGTEFTLKVDAVISAVSQGIGGSAGALGVKVLKDRIATTAGAATSVAGTFAAGDAVTGPDNIIGAVAGGYEAAAEADRFLSGEARFLESSPELTPADKDLVLLRNRTIARRERVKPQLRAAEERKRDFETFLEPMSEAEAVAEAARCLRCGCSVTCGLCHRICSSFAISLEKDGYDIAKDKCHACGMCAQLCPNRNIEIVAEETGIAAR